MNITGPGNPLGAYAAQAVVPTSKVDRVPKSGESSRDSTQDGKLSAQAEAQLSRLRARDRQVRDHEQAHLTAAAGLATSGANYTYQRGPDGVQYAVGGEVGIDTSEGKTPEETLQRARTIRTAALAPADPSSQDRAVAARAGQMEVDANAQIAQARATEAGGGAQPAVERAGVESAEGEMISTSRRRVSVYA